MSTSPSEGLEPFRRRLDTIDDQIARLLGERLEICREVAAYKSEHEIPMMQPERVKIVRERYLARGAEHDLPQEFTSDLFDLLIATTCRLEDELMDELAAKNGKGAA
ncbi:MAG TPA: chorismate mutase [Solirubrobacterales bacterium]|nr:chorismate mutase [Solirubrobacterales bacterium]